MSSPKPEPQTAPAQNTVESAIEHAKRAFALKKYEQAVEHYATALELMVPKVGENSPEVADLYFSYGKALLENAIAQSSVLGKEEPTEGKEEEAPVANTSGGPILSFSGDAEDEDDPALDLSAIADEQGGDEEGDEDGEGDDGEPEDDFNAAWEVLDLARAIYEKQKDEDEEVKLKLADTFITLGDVSLETEKFDQAITDYEAGLALKNDILPISSRHIAEAHYKLSIVLDLTPGRLAEAITHAEKALESIESRLVELRDGLQAPTQPAASAAPAEETKPDVKGKGKATPKLIRDDLVEKMTKSQIEGEIKELTELREDLALKVEELKTSPANDTSTMSAPALAAHALDKELNTGTSAPVPQAAVNDLTGIVKKKKKVAVEGDAAGSTNGNGKRKAETDADDSGAEKKVKLDTES